MDNSHDQLAALLLRHLPKDLVLGVMEGFEVGAARAYAAGRIMADGHQPHVIGQLRHFHMNEAFYAALSAAGAGPSKIQGNRLVTGASGIFRLGRFNIPVGAWKNAKRGKTRQQMALANQAIEQLVQRDMFVGALPIREAVAFFVGVFSGNVKDRPERPVAIEVALPSKNMEHWIFRESIMAFLERYDAKTTPANQEDNAVPKLRRGLGKRTGNGEQAG